MQQFILSEVFQAIVAYKNKGSFETIFSRQSFLYPLDCSSYSGHLNRIHEHCDLLKHAFPNNKQSTSLFQHALTNTLNLILNYQENPSSSQYFDQELHAYLKQLFLLLEPLVEECKNDENFIFFLLKHQQEIIFLSHNRHLLRLLKKMHPEGLEAIREQICDNFHARGFASLIPEVGILITQLQKDYENE
jgi:hypothetical protein